MKKIIRWLGLMMLLVISVLAGCGRLADLQNPPPAPELVIVEHGETIADEHQSGSSGRETESEPETDVIVIDPTPGRIPVKAKGIYISSYVAGTIPMVDSLIAEIDRTEANTLVIDLKDDFGRIACKMDSPLVKEVGSVKVCISEMEQLMKKLKEHDIYVIARIPAFRDAWLGEAKPDWCVKLADGTVFRDRDGNAWVNPYKQEAWDYLAEIGTQARRLGFDEVQFDYVRFCTEKGMQDAVFDKEDVKGRSRTDIILEFMEYMYQKLKDEGLFVSADVFGAIINSDVNANSVGQIYGEMAKHLDYISPMIYPSHYNDGYYGIDYPDMHPYDTISAALADSRKELYFAGQDGGHVAVVRPWLQDFTASWLDHYISYGPEEVRMQIQAVYDAGYDEWLLWDASCRYEWSALLTPEAAKEEAKQIAESRAALPEAVYIPETDSVPTGSAGPSVRDTAGTTDNTTGAGRGTQ